MIKNEDIFEPSPKIDVFQRYLHALALVQNEKDPQDWNVNTLLQTIESNEKKDGGQIQETGFRKTMVSYFKKLGTPLKGNKGKRRIELQQQPSNEQLRDLIRVYSSFVVYDNSMEKAIDRLIKKHNDQSMWLLARLYLASKNREIVTFNYQANSDRKQHNFKVYPYYLIFNENNLYLTCYNIEKKNNSLFILNRIEYNSLKITGKIPEDAVRPPIEQLFKSSISAFINNNQTTVTLQYNKRKKENLDDLLDCLAPKIKKLKQSDAYDYEISFKISDDLSLLKQLFLYGKDVEIVSPPELRKKMAKMLKESLEIYKEDKQL